MNKRFKSEHDNDTTTLREYWRYLKWKKFLIRKLHGFSNEIKTRSWFISLSHEASHLPYIFSNFINISNKYNVNMNWPNDSTFVDMSTEIKLKITPMINHNNLHYRLWMFVYDKSWISGNRYYGFIQRHGCTVIRIQ